MWQVVPEKPSEDPWISARCGAACGLVNGNVLVTLEGTGRYGPVGRDDMTLFTVKRGIGARIATKAGTSGDGDSCPVSDTRFTGPNVIIQSIT